ncbi:MAG: hypothetical protein KGV46_02785 [Pasteurella sp.]|nr:hypothetical protein [Pasteurella sp.]
MWVLKLLILLLINIGWIALSIAVSFFVNHIFGFLFGIGFKSLGGEPTLEILGIELIIVLAIGGVLWFLQEVVYKKLTE